MKFKTTISLVVLAIIVALFFVFTSTENNGSLPASTSINKQGTALPISKNINESNINKITITRNKKTVVIIKKDDNWKQIEPVTFPVQTYQLTNIINDATSLRYVEKFIPSKNSEMPDLNAVGLKNPKATLTLLTKDGNSATYKIGSRSIGGRGYIMLKNDKHVYVVENKLQKEIIDSGIKNWRRTSFSAPKASSAGMVSLKRAKNQVILNKYKGRWYIGKKDSQRASKDSVSSLLSSLSTVNIDKFISDNPKKLSTYGLENPTLTLVVKKPAVKENKSKDKNKDSKDNSTNNKGKTKKPEVFKLRIGSPATLSKNSDDTKYFATWSDNGKGAKVVFTIDSSSFKDLNKSKDDLRDSKVVTTPDDEVQAITIKRSNSKTIHFNKNNNKFVFADPKPEYKLDNQAASSLLNQLTSAKADGYIPNYKPKSKPLATVKIEQRGVGATETLHVYSKSKADGYITIRNSEPVGYKVSSDNLSKLFEPVLALRNKIITDIKKDDISAITLKRGDGVVYDFSKSQPAATKADDTQASTSNEGKWELSGNTKFESDDFDDLLSALSDLRIKKWMDKDETPTSNWITLTIKTRGSSPLVLSMNPKNNYGTISNAKGTFIFKDSFAKKLKTEYRTRLLLDIQTDDIKQVKITNQDNSDLVISKNSNGDYQLKSKMPEDKKLSQSKAADIFDSLAGLSAKRFTPKHNFSAITRTLQVSTKRGGDIKLEIYSNSGESGISGKGAYIVGKLNGKKLSKWFILSKDNVKKVTQKVLENKSSNS